VDAVTRLNNLAEQVHQIPTLPAVYNRAIGLLNDPYSSASQIGNVLSHDQAIAARLLRIVNSSFYGFRYRISNVTHAITMIGFRGVEDLILTLSVFPTLQLGAGESAQDERSFWFHSVSCAACARAAIRMLRFAGGEEAFTVGLLHDIGKVALLRFSRNEFLEVMRVARERNEPIHKVEKELLGFTHADVGKILAERWQFPRNLVEVIAYHHTPKKAKHFRRYVCAIHVADILSRVAVADQSNDRVPQLDMDAWDETGLQPCQIEALMKAGSEEFNKARAFLSILE